MIYQNIHYTNDEGEQISETKPIDGSESKFRGHAIVGIRVPQSPHPLEHPITFPIKNAKNIEEAFSNFKSSRDEEGPKVAEKMINQMKEEAQEMQRQKQSQIVVPNGTSFPNDIHG